MADDSLETALRRSAFLVVSGLAVELAASAWVHPLAFVAFLVVACPLVGAGMLVFLWGLAHAESSSTR
jgi:hypothetical protein